uniref:Glutaminase n=1 Tax=Moniliophthora roreri TaxID=221103 RepID=A0A0W0EZL0_MONRR
MLSFRILCIFLSVLWQIHIARGAVSWEATPFNPPSFPLAVRHPYLSAWLHQGNGTALNGGWPMFWNTRIVGWAGFIKVDGKAYSYLGDPRADAPFEKAKQKSSQFTSTQSTFVLSAGPVDLTVNFLSPVEPEDLVKQSLPFSYMALSVTSTDGNSHSVQIYSDVSAEWCSGDSALAVNWTTTTGNTLIHQAQLQNQTEFAEIGDQIQHGTFYYSTSSGNGVTYQTGADVTLRTGFIRDGRLNDTQDTNFRAIGDRFPVFAFAHDIGSITSSSKPVVIALGHVRDPVIQYIVANGQLQNRSPYFLAQFSDPRDAITSFLGDYDSALPRAKALDTKVNDDASKISSDYAGVVALSVRQFFGTMEITISKKDDGSLNTDDVLVFMKEISSNGNMNTVDVIFPAWPAMLYFNPAIGKYLLDAHFQYQSTGQYPNKYALHDLGAHYPQALGHNDGKDEAMPVEESGNMVIMALSYAEKTGDNSQIIKYANLLEQWTQFLVDDALIPANQISTDDFAGPLANQTNLAIKGIIGIQAMSKIAAILGDSAKSSNYDSIAKLYVTQWQSLATASDGKHLMLAYGNESSWGLSYNLYADKLLGLNLFPQSVYDMQTAWYKTVAKPFGVPLDTRHTWTKSDWEIWTAAIMTDTNVRDMLITAVKGFASGQASSQPFGDWYETQDGKPQGFRARPVVGGHLALLALQSSPNGSPTSPPTSQDPASRTNNSAVAKWTRASHIVIFLSSFVWLSNAF